MLKCPACEKEIPDDSKFCNECGYSFSGGSQTGQLNPDTILENRYIIVKTLGRGGMGAVYMALDSRLNNIPVAIKEMSTRAVGGDLQAAIGAFKKEASMLINLRHPALPRILDFFSRGEDRWYLVMDFIEGQTLAELAQSRGPLPEAEVLDWARQICEILDYLHQQNPPIIFRDLKPANIMLTPKGQIKLIDFGIARHFRVGSSADTAAYGSHGFAPPEQYGENQTSPSSDIYALGATMHYLLTGIDPGKNPFIFEPPGKIVKVSPRVDAAIMKALELKAENRPKDMQEMLKLLPGGALRPIPRASANQTQVNNTPEPFETAEKRLLQPSEKDNKNMIPEVTPAELDKKAGENETILIDISPDDTPTIAIDSKQSDNMQGTATMPMTNDVFGLPMAKQNHEKAPTKILQQTKKPGATRDIIIAACLVLVLLSGGIYGYKHYNGKQAAPVIQGNNSSAKAQTSNLGTGNQDSTTSYAGDAVDNKQNNQKENGSRKIVFNDPALEKCIRDALNKPQGDIYVSDVKDIQRLVLRGKGIKDISAISKLTNLQELYLSDNQISNISAISNLTKLKSLYLERNQISNISAISNLAKLQVLYLNINQISNISGLSNLTNLQQLYLGYNQISNISAISNLTNLQQLYLGYNQISNISAISNLTNLQELYLYNNKISNISAISNLTNLQVLNLGGNQISNISGLSNLINLQQLHLGYNQISNISGLSNLTNLQKLYLDNNPISDYSPTQSYYQNLKDKDFTL